jgi:hypothetical protein
VQITGAFCFDERGQFALENRNTDHYPAPQMIAGFTPCFGLFVGVGLILTQCPIRAETISLQPVADTTLIEISSENNLGGAGFFNAGTTGNGFRNRAVMRYDLSSIPAGSIINSVELTLEIVREPVTDPENSFFSLRRLFQSWGEGVQVPTEVDSPGRGAPAVMGEATWNSRFTGLSAWSEPGGQQGVDFSATASSLAFVTTVGEQVNFGSTPAMIADLQFWLDQPSANFGWMLMTESEDVGKTARSFASLESGFGPTLTIDFTPVPEPATISLVALFLCCAHAFRRRK